MPLVKCVLIKVNFSMAAHSTYSFVYALNKNNSITESFTVQNALRKKEYGFFFISPDPEDTVNL